MHVTECDTVRSGCRLDRATIYGEGDVLAIDEVTDSGLVKAR